MPAPGQTALIAVLAGALACGADVGEGSGGGDASGARTSGEVVEVERQAWLMGTTFTARVGAEDRDAAVAATEAVFDEVARLESILSSWDSTTAMGRLNRAPVGEPVTVPDELLDLLIRADRLAESVDRAFEPAIGPLVDAWGVRTGIRPPSPGEREAALEAIHAGFSIDTVARTVTRMHPAVWMDAGGFGKGAALEVAGRVLADLDVDRALLDFGGQSLTVGTREGGGAWRIAVAHPDRRQEPAAELRLGPGLSVATSGGSERPGHILDPRTGSPPGSWGSVTVVSPDPVVADAMATALFAMGPHAAPAWAASRDDLGVLVLDPGPDGLDARWNPAMATWLDTTAAGLLRREATGGSTEPSP